MKLEEILNPLLGDLDNGYNTFEKVEDDLEKLIEEAYKTGYNAGSMDEWLLTDRGEFNKETAWDLYKRSILSYYN